MKKIIAGAVGLSASLCAFSVAAEPAFTADAPQVGVGLGYGIFMGDDEGDPPNPYAFGLNARGGYTLGMGLYVGAALDYFLGSSDEQTVPFLGTIEYSQNIYQVGAEVGYDIGASPTVVVRPKVGLAYATIVGEVNGTENDESGLAISPGVQALIDMDAFFLSADARYNIFSIESESTDPNTGATVTNDFDASGLLIGVGVGMAF
jgi:hypothetical protein